MQHLKIRIFNNLWKNFSNEKFPKSLKWKVLEWTISSETSK